MTRERYEIRFLPLEPHRTSQDEAWLTLGVGDELVRLRFHDYAAIYVLPGLYEQLMGAELQRLGVARLVGIDILPEARDAACRRARGAGSRHARCSRFVPFPSIS